MSKIYTVAFVAPPVHRWQKEVEIHRYTYTELVEICPTEVTLSELVLIGKTQFMWEKREVTLIDCERAALFFAKA